MPIEAPGPVIEVINPTVMSAAAAGKAITEAMATAAAKRTNGARAPPKLAAKTNNHARSPSIACM